MPTFDIFSWPITATYEKKTIEYYNIAFKLNIKNYSKSLN